MRSSSWAVEMHHVAELGRGEAQGLGTSRVVGSTRRSWLDAGLGGQHGGLLGKEHGACRDLNRLDLWTNPRKSNLVLPSPATWDAPF